MSTRLSLYGHRHTAVHPGGGMSGLPVRTKEALDALAEGLFGFAPDDTVKAVVAKPAGPQFDYAAGVKAARAAYPELRKKGKVLEDLRRPGSDDPPSLPK